MIFKEHSSFLSESVILRDVCFNKTEWMKLYNIREGCVGSEEKKGGEHSVVMIMKRVCLSFWVYYVWSKYIFKESCKTATNCVKFIWQYIHSGSV